MARAAPSINTGLVETVISAIRFMLPPRGSDRRGQTRWRWLVFVMLCAIMLGGALHLLLECGYLASVFPGYATTADVARLESRVDALQTVSMEERMLTKAAERCEAKDSRTKQELSADIARLEYDYHAIAKAWYRVPGCSEL
jgi:hypothetical protein